MRENSGEKVAMVVPYKFTPPINGGHKAAFGFTHFLAKKAPLICLSSNNNLSEDLPFTLHGLFKDQVSKYLNPLVAWRIRKRLIQEKVKYLILFQPFMGIMLVPIAWLSKIKWGVYIQNIEYQRFKSMGKWWWPLLFILEKIIYRSANFLLFISPHDFQEGQRVFKLSAKKCDVVSYGTYLEKPTPSSNATRVEIVEKHGLDPNAYLILFFGPQSYQPNLEAVLRIANEINPILKEKTAFNYQILICGGGLPPKYTSIKSMQDQGLYYLGFVEDIEAYVQSADLVINPINTGGGVKTKIIEAIALGKTVISSQTGAIGMDTAACQEKLVQVPDEDFTAWADAIITQQKNVSIATPDSFYKVYYWGNAIAPVLKFIKPKP